ncbi:MAG: hypothetical protein II341_01380, partial [Oscillospiraceae bacterium]|nr:hypothetical protein [Oscillospiraceae bacterium]
MKRTYKTISALTISLLACAGMTAVSAAAADGFVYDEDGGASYLKNGTALTGKFSIAKDYNLGDVSGDDVVSSTDAASILSAAALSGAGDLSTEEVLAASGSFLKDAETALMYADTNEDSSINASDAAVILDYAARTGSGAELAPLGFAYYYADADGLLCTGFITDGTETYYAGEDYKLCTGWQTLDGERYYFGTDAVLCTEWQTLGSGVYYFGTDGALRTGWQTIGGEQYYFSTSGIMQTGMQTIGTSKYYFNADGTMHTGWLEYEGKTYR